MREKERAAKSLGSGTPAGFLDALVRSQMLQTGITTSRTQVCTASRVFVVPRSTR